MISKIKRIHCVGIGGAGMGGIAEVLIRLGFVVSGTDLVENEMVLHLRSQGADIALSHEVSENLTSSDVVVVSSAIDEQNPEIVCAKHHRIPVVPRAEMLSELMRFKHGIAVAGTHGKTTTTSLIASVLAEGGLDPTFVIGGQLNSAGSNARLGDSRYFVAEADESDASFLYMQPMVAVVTNIDHDHLSNFNDDFSELVQVFVEFLHHLPFYGVAVLCIDDAEVKKLIPKVTRTVKTYGFSEDADVRAIDFVQRGTQSHFSVQVGDLAPFAMTLNLPGRHNVLNALAAITVAYEEGVSLEKIGRGLAEFQGIARRFEVYGDIETEQGVITVVDDYGHHPVEIARTIEAIRDAWQNRRLVMIFQPHRYSRTLALFEDFSSTLSAVDQLILLDVYPAGESPIPGADGRALSRSIRLRGQVDPIFVQKVSDIPGILPGILQDGDILLMQGAGDVGQLAKTWVDHD